MGLEFTPSATVLDGIASLTHGPTDPEVSSMVARQIDLLRTRGSPRWRPPSRAGERSTVGISSLVDTWLLLRNVESNGERDRLLLVLKSRGSPRSSQVREFVLTDHGAELIDVYVSATRPTR